jgi:hypothetical protein
MHRGMQANGLPYLVAWGNVPGGEMYDSVAASAVRVWGLFGISNPCLPKDVLDIA